LFQLRISIHLAKPKTQQKCPWVHIYVGPRSTRIKEETVVKAHCSSPNPTTPTNKLFAPKCLILHFTFILISTCLLVFIFLIFFTLFLKLSPKFYVQYLNLNWTTSTYPFLILISKWFPLHASNYKYANHDSFSLKILQNQVSLCLANPSKHCFVAMTSEQELHIHFTIIK